MRMSALDRDQIKAQKEIERKIAKDQLEREVEIAKAAGTYLGKRSKRKLKRVQNGLRCNETDCEILRSYPTINESPPCPHQDRGILFPNLTGRVCHCDAEAGEIQRR